MYSERRESVRHRLERDLGHALEDEAWYTLVGGDWVDEVLQGRDAGYAELREKAKELHAIFRGVAPRGRKVRQKTATKEQDEPLFSELEQVRSDALYEYFAMLASNEPDVRLFREEVLGGQLLDSEAAWAFVRSPATQCFPLGMFRSRGVSPIDHTAQIVETQTREEDGKLIDWIVVRVEPKGVEWKMRQSIQARARMRMLAFPDRPEMLGTEPTGMVARVLADFDSVLDDLRRVVHVLTDRYPWEEYQGTWFVLTGAIPVWRPIRRRINRTWHTDFEYQALTLRIEPWVSERTVLRVYRETQRKLLRGRENRPVSRKNLDLFRFCVRRMDTPEAAMDWPAALREWNEANPSDHVPDVRAFRRVFDRIQRQLLFPSYGEPW